MKTWEKKEGSAEGAGRIVYPRRRKRALAPGFELSSGLGGAALCIPTIMIFG